MFSFEEQGKYFVSLEQNEKSNQYYIPQTGVPQGSNDGPIFGNLGIDLLLKKLTASADE